MIRLLWTIAAGLVELAIDLVAQRRAPEVVVDTLTDEDRDRMQWHPFNGAIQ